MKLTLQSREGDVVLLKLEGRVSQRDVALTDDPLQDLLGDDAHRLKLVVDMSEVMSLDSSGVNWLLSCHRQAREKGGVLILHSLSPIARNVIRVLNLHTVLNVVPDEQAADRMLKGDD